MTQPTKEQIREALEALDYLTDDGEYCEIGLAAIRTLREALQAPVPEVVTSKEISKLLGGECLKRNMNFLGLQDTVQLLMDNYVVIKESE